MYYSIYFISGQIAVFAFIITKILIHQILFEYYNKLNKIVNPQLINKNLKKLYTKKTP